MRKRFLWGLAAAAIAALSLAPAASAYPGELDTSFNATGYAFTHFPGAMSRAADVAVQDDGKVVVAGTYGSGEQFAVARYDPDGTLDETFGANGLVTTPMGVTSSDVRATSVAIQPDDKIVVGGMARVAGPNPGTSGVGFALARYLPNGGLDPGFGAGGRVHTFIKTAGVDFCSGEVLNALALHGGTIYATGAKACEGQSGPYVARYLGNGTLDPTYGPGGPDGIDGVAYSDDHANGAVDMIVTADGSAIVVGRAYGFQGSSITRYTPGGTKDPSFGNGGVVSRPNELVSIVAVPDGKFVTLTRFGAELRLALARFDAANGAIDGTFGTGGTVMTQFPGPGSMGASDLARDADGRLISASRRIATGVDGLTLQRWSADGAFDTHFGFKGESAAVPGTVASALTVDAENRPVAVGTCGCGPDAFAVARYLTGAGANRLPTASFTWTPTEPFSNETMTFDATASDDPDAPIANYSWDLDGSGNFASNGGSSPYLSGGISFPRPGVHTVRLRVTDADGATTTTSREVTVRGRPPDARLTASPSAVFTNERMILDASASSDSDGSIVNYRWDLDASGSFARDTGADAATVTSFADPGRHVVRVRVTDDTGMQGVAEVAVTVVDDGSGPGPGPSPGPSPEPEPAKAAVTIDGGAGFTRRRVVTLSILPPPGATTIEVSNHRDFAGARTFAVTPAGTYRWRLDPRGVERVPKTVFVRFGGSLVVAPTEVFTDTIVLDETPPRLLPPVLLRSSSGAVRALGVSASDRTSGVRGLNVTTNRRRPGRLRAYRRLVAFSASRSAAVYVRALDRAGNASRWRRAR